MRPDATATAASRRPARSSLGLALAWTAALAPGLAPWGCASGRTRFPWPAPGGSSPTEHAEVTTANTGYRRTSSQVLVREVARPTRANLDWAAYHANFMNADPEPEGQGAAAGGGRRPDASRPFDGALDAATLAGALAATPLTAEERGRPLAFAPLVALLASKRIAGADRLEDVGAAIRAEDWGLGGGPQHARQTATALFVHQAGKDGESGAGAELWVKVEFAPSFKVFSAMPDEDGDGFPEIYGRVPAARMGPEAVRAVVSFVRDDYAGRTLSPAEVKAWAHQLASYWYPSYNTDLVTAGPAWPDADTEASVRAELAGATFASPAVVMRGKPLGQPVYNVFLVKGGGPASAAGGPSSAAASPAAAKGPSLPRTQPSPDPAPLARAIEAEVSAHGGSFARWIAEVAPLHESIRRRLAVTPPATKAIAGDGGFLFFRQSLAYVVGGDLTRQRRPKNPVPAIVAFRALLAERGVDLLFVPVPTKVEIYPDKLPGGDRRFAGQVANPYQRKLLLELAAQGVEVVDLLPLFLRDRARALAGGGGGREELYQAQDTHWSSHGLELAARAVAERVKRYPWFRPLTAAPHLKKYRTQETTFSRYGDLHSRLAEAEKGRHRPEAVLGRQVLAPGGGLYDDDPESPIVLLGDSFTGVFQLMDCEHAGVSAHLAKELGYPVDLVMSYGGGPNVRGKLLRRGKEALSSKRLVIWMMTNRDLYDFWEGWQVASGR